MSRITLPLITISRHRLVTDGDGVTTLVAAKGCPLSCRYCLNKNVLEDTVPSRPVTPEELLKTVAIDDLYFKATNGGVVFGGGESLLHAEFLREWHAIAPKEWRTIAETCLNVPSELFETALDAVDSWIVDIKDMNPEIYRAYTGRDNGQVIANLKRLAEAGRCGDVTVRVPLIPGYNTEEDCARSVEALKAIGNWKNYDLFRYVIRE